MTKFFLLLLLGFNSLSLKAEEHPLTNRFSMKLWSELNQSKKDKFDNFRKATFSFDNIDKNGKRGFSCSGTYISDSGHILTALHCVRSCIWSNLEAVKKEQGESWFDFNNKNTIYHSVQGVKKSIYDAEIDHENDPTYLRTVKVSTFDLLPETFKGLKCNMLINSNKVEVELLGAGNGHLWPYFPNRLDNEDEKKLWRSLVQQGYGASGDFALLKEIKPRKSISCISITDEELRKGERLHTLSNTCSKKNKRDGSTVFYDEGIEATNKFSKYDSFKSSQIFVSTLNAESCSSGSAVVDEKGDIKGVLVIANNYHDNTSSPILHNSNIAIGIKTDHILNTLRSRWDIDISDLICTTKNIKGP